MDAFFAIVVVGVAALVGALVLLAKLYPGSGADLLDWQPTRSYEQEIELEMQDVQQMIDAQNEYRRRRGEREITEDEVREVVAREQEEKLAREEEILAREAEAKLTREAPARRRPS